MPKEAVDSIDKLNHYLPLIGLAYTVVIFWVGHFIGHRTALNRDRRKEFNTVADPISLSLLSQKSDLESGMWPSKFIKASDYHALLLCSDRTQKRSLESAWKSYTVAFDNSNPIYKDGVFVSFDNQALLTAVVNLLKVTAHK